MQGLPYHDIPPNMVRVISPYQYTDQPSVRYVPIDQHMVRWDVSIDRYVSPIPVPCRNGNIPLIPSGILRYDEPCRPIWAVQTNPIRDQYGLYILVCWYIPPYHVSIHWYDSIHTVPTVNWYTGID